MVLRGTELAAIAEVAVEADLLVLTDEVYEHLVFDDARHMPLAGFPGMADRTVTISSAAKMFNCTGWKIGWACGDADLIAGVRAAKQFLSYVGGAPFQPAVALALATQQDWVITLRKTLQARRDRLAAGLRKSGSTSTTAAAPTSCAPTHVLSAIPTAPRSAPSCRTAPAWPRSRCRRSVIPTAEHAAAWNHLVRFTFCKKDDTLDEALRRLSTLR